MGPIRRELGDEGTSRLLEHHVRGDAAFDDSLELHPVRGMRTLWPGRRTVPQQEVSAKGQRYPVASVCTQLNSGDSPFCVIVPYTSRLDPAATAAARGDGT
ncbi:MAG: hypothetical protein DMD77_13465 [Candidatus Rokuibacteriota bacterium]|nr:MAG: hypothetical protein DMD77_13465 [Candidatus Rokubacteria bacterium]